MNLSAFSTLFFLVFSTTFFPKRAAKIGGMNLPFQIFLLKHNVTIGKVALVAGLLANLFLKQAEDQGENGPKCLYPVNTIPIDGLRQAQPDISPIQNNHRDTPLS
jgi:hypothetical protein